MGHKSPRPRSQLTASAIGNAHNRQLTAEDGGLSYLGLECYQPSFYPAEECPYSGMCTPGSTCTTWRTGFFPQDSYSLPGSKGNLHGCPCGADCEGSFQEERWKPNDQSCPAIWMSPFEMRERINGRRILLVGDSLMRQVFLRAVAHMRGLEAIVEHYFHHDATYVMNGTHDVLSLFDKLSSGRVDDVVKGARQVEIEYMWATSELISRRSLDMVRPKIAVMSINLWCDKSCFRLQNIPGRTHELIHDNEYLEQIVWLTTASVHGDVHGLPRRYSSLNEFWERNAAMRAWVADVRALTNVTLTIVGLDRLVEHSPWGRNIHPDEGISDPHFQCSFLDQYPAYVRRWIKSPKSADCRDLLNLNVVQLIMGSI